MLALAVILFCLAGLLVGSGGSILFLAPPAEAPWALFAVVGVVLVFALALWALGSACLRFRRWRAHLGWVMAGGALVDLMSALSIGAGISDENTRRVYGPEALRQFENANLGLGFGFIIVLGAIAGLLILLQSRRDARAEAASDAAVAETFR